MTPRMTADASGGIARGDNKGVATTQYAAARRTKISHWAADQGFASVLTFACWCGSIY